MKLRWFTKGLLGIAMLLLLWQFFTKLYTEASIYFSLTLISLAVGLDLVRAELTELRRSITAKDEQ